MADIKINMPSHDGELGEHGEHGERGHRGHRGHDGPTSAAGTAGLGGPTGPTEAPGATGPTGATGTAASALFWGALGTAQNLFVRHNGATGDGTPIDYQVLRNGLITGITVAVPTNTVDQQSDLVNTAAFTIGDQISIIASKGAGVTPHPVSATVSIDFMPL